MALLLTGLSHVDVGFTVFVQGDLDLPGLAADLAVFDVLLRVASGFIDHDYVGLTAVGTGDGGVHWAERLKAKG